MVMVDLRMNVKKASVFEKTVLVLFVLLIFFMATFSLLTLKK